MMPGRTTYKRLFPLPFSGWNLRSRRRQVTIWGFDGDPLYLLIPVAALAVQGGGLVSGLQSLTAVARGMPGGYATALPALALSLLLTVSGLGFRITVSLSGVRVFKTWWWIPYHWRSFGLDARVSTESDRATIEERNGSRETSVGNRWNYRELEDAIHWACLGGGRFADDW